MGAPTIAGVAARLITMNAAFTGLEPGSAALPGMLLRVCSITIPDIIANVVTRPWAVVLSPTDATDLPPWTAPALEQDSVASTALAIHLLPSSRRIQTSMSVTRCPFEPRLPNTSGTGSEGVSTYRSPAF